jgi:hypothetical protein
MIRCGSVLTDARPKGDVSGISSGRSSMGTPSDPGTQAAILAAAELVVAAECARAKVLADGGDVEQLIRLENLAARATLRLGVKPNSTSKPPTLAEHLAQKHGKPQRG